MAERVEPTDGREDGACADATWRERLPELATALALGGLGEGGDPELAAHLAGCAACRAELEALVALTEAAYAGEVMPATAYPDPDLSFLRRPMPEADSDTARPRREWWIDEAGRFVLQFSRALLDVLRPPALVGAARGQLLYRYAQAAGTFAELALTIEIFAEEADPAQVRVSVAAELPGRDPLDQAGSRVILRAPGLSRSGVTDETGGVDFGGVPLGALADLRIMVRLDAPVRA